MDSEACRGSKLKGDEIHPRGKTLDVVSIGDHGAVSVRDVIGDDEQVQDFRSCMRTLGRWSKWAVLIEMALVAYAKIFISDIVEEKNT